MPGVSKRQAKFLWGRLNSSFWFVPAVLTLVSVALFGITQYLVEAAIAAAFPEARESG